MPEEKETPATPKIVQNGITRPKSGTKTGHVYDVADALSRETGAPAKRAAVMAACEKDGLNVATIATQYGRWRKFMGLSRKEEVGAAEVPEEVDEEVIEEPVESDEEADAPE